MPRGDKPTTPALALKDGWIYEDTLPASITKDEYEWWFKESLVLDGVRMGPPLTTKPQSTDLGIDTNFPLSETLRLLVEWAQHLHVSHECDCDGWEQRSFLIEAAQRYQAEIAQSSSPPVVDTALFSEMNARLTADALAHHNAAHFAPNNPVKLSECRERSCVERWELLNRVSEVVVSHAAAATAAPQQVAGDLLRDAGAIIIVNEGGAGARVEIRFAELRDAQRLHKTLIQSRATAAPVEQSDASQSCQRCGRIGGKIVNFNYDSITASRWICPHCLDADEGAR